MRSSKRLQLALQRFSSSFPHFDRINNFSSHPPNSCIDMLSFWRKLDLCAIRPEPFSVGPEVYSDSRPVVVLALPVGSNHHSIPFLLLHPLLLTLAPRHCLQVVTPTPLVGGGPTGVFFLFSWERPTGSGPGSPPPLGGACKRSGGATAPEGNDFSCLDFGDFFKKLQ